MNIQSDEDCPGLAGSASINGSPIVVDNTETPLSESYERNERTEPSVIDKPQGDDKADGPLADDSNWQDAPRSKKQWAKKSSTEDAATEAEPSSAAAKASRDTGPLEANIRDLLVERTRAQNEKWADESSDSDFDPYPDAGRPEETATGKSMDFSIDGDIFVESIIARGEAIMHLNGGLVKMDVENRRLVPVSRADAVSKYL
jgi:hypothetical protein